MQGWAYYKREIRDWSYTILALSALWLSGLFAVSALAFAATEVVLWLKYGIYIKVSFLVLLEYNEIPPPAFATNWVGVQKIILFIADLSMWASLFILCITFRVIAISIMEHQKEIYEAESVRSNAAESITDYGPYD
jgi:hypothetical protein